MLSIIIPSGEYWDESKQEFLYFQKDQQLTLEHSLVSISKWESKWNVPWIGRKKSNPESVDYIRCMTLTQNVDPDVYRRITSSHIKKVNEYCSAPMTATTFTIRDKGRPSREIITAELIYYWMILYGIPFDPCQKWHLNRLLTLIRVCNIKSQTDKKMPPGEVLKEQASLNALRRKKWRTTG